MMANKHWTLLGTYFLYISICCVYCCDKNSMQLGYAEPPEDINLIYGKTNTLNITCNLCKDHIRKGDLRPSLNMTFTKNTLKLPKEYVEIVNDTAIRLYIENAPKESNVNYMCTYHGIMVALNVVTVGVPPQNVTDFHCLSKNLDMLICSWTPPENYFKTQYDLQFHVARRADRVNENFNATWQRSLYSCPQDLSKSSKTNGTMNCTYTASTNPQYRQSHSELYFHLNMSNRAGENSLHYKFNHYKYVKPNPPEDLKLVPFANDSIQVTWTLPLSMQSFAAPLEHRIFYQTEFDQKTTWHYSGNLIRPKDGPKDLAFFIENIIYGNTLCDVRVSMRSAYADPNDEFMWSNNASETVRTLSKKPAQPPRTTFGNFEIINLINERRVKFYWQRTDPKHRNGVPFNYTIEWDSARKYRRLQVRPTNPNIEPETQAEFSAIDKDQDHYFYIYSQNSVGKSDGYATVHIPREMNPINGDIAAQLGFTKTAFNGNNYTLQWSIPRSIVEPVTNYTVFWCNSNKDRPYPCNGVLHWEIVSNTTTKYNIFDAQDNYQFAIAVNTEHYSSGMIWAECTVVPNFTSKLRKVNVTRPGDTFVDLQWENDCSDYNKLIKGYRFYYCRMGTPTSDECIGKEHNFMIEGDATLSHGRITGLLPYTSFRIRGVIISNDSESQQLSHPVYTTTLEGAPSKPNNVTFTEVTNSSISLAWLPPKQPNGVLRYYEVTFRTNEKGYEDRIKKIDAERSNSWIYHSETHLTGYKNYLITVKACIIQCSEGVHLNMTTKMGSPTVIKQPYISNQNESIITFEWTEPKESNGRLDFYQLRCRKSENDAGTLYNVTGIKYGLENPCKVSGPMYISVRAVNVLSNVSFNGPWSDDFYLTCGQSDLMIILVSSGALFLLMAVLYGCKWCVKRCRVMRDVEVKLPPGLSSGVDVTSWQTQDKHDDKRDTRSPPDEQSLLAKSEKNDTELKHLSNDTSGCSSEHDSVTSSLETGTNVSDSGTEQAITGSSDEMRRHSLRQRNVAAKSGYLPFTSDMTKAAGTTAAGSYCQLGVDPMLDTPDPYVQAGNKFDLEPYVMGDLIKTPNPNYVPFDSGDMMRNSSGYVVAGRKDVLVPELLQVAEVVDDKPYVKVSDALLWPQTETGATTTTTTKGGYVSVGEAMPPQPPVVVSVQQTQMAAQKQIADHAKGYIPHRQFEAKSLKED